MSILDVLRLWRVTLLFCEAGLGGRRGGEEIGWTGSVGEDGRSTDFCELEELVGSRGEEVKAENSPPCFTPAEMPRSSAGEPLNRESPGRAASLELIEVFGTDAFESFDKLASIFGALLSAPNWCGASSISVSLTSSDPFVRRDGTTELSVDLRSIVSRSEGGLDAPPARTL
jgi:hypothetical protein